jgi:hypothetical protein
MSIYFIAGLSLGTGIPLYLSDRNFLTLWNGIYRPHKEYRERKAISMNKTHQITEYDYVYYILDTLNSFWYMTKSFVYLGHKNFLQTRQNTCLQLTTNFEYLNETLSNIDYINSNIQRIQNLHLEREKQKMGESFSSEDMNLQNIQRMKEIAKDDYQKYSLDNSVMTMENRIKSQNVFDFYKTNSKNMKMAMDHHNALQEFNFYKKQDNMLFGDIRMSNIQRVNRDDLYKNKRIRTYDQIQTEKLQGDMKELQDLFNEYKN